MAHDPVAVKSIVKGLRLHPRVAYQGFLADDAVRARLLAGLPDLVPFHQISVRAG